MATEILEQMRVAFRAEAQDLLIELDSALLALEADASEAALVNRVFRAIHTLKGSGAMAGYGRLARFAHKIEEAFDRAREGRLVVTPELIDWGLKACDVIKRILEAGDEGMVVEGEAEVQAAFVRLAPDGAASPAGAVAVAHEAQGRAAFEVVLKPNRDIFYSGADPVTLLDDLRSLGAAHITAHTEETPALGALDAEHCYLWWEVLLITDRGEQAIREVFLFVEDECEVRIRLLEDQGQAVAFLGAVPAEAFECFRAECEERLGEIEQDALALERDPGSRERLDALFRGVHSIKGNAGVLLGHVSGGALTESHPLRLLVRVAHALESLLDPLRRPDAAPAPAEAIETALRTCDAIRTLTGNLAGAAGSVPRELLVRLRLEADGGAAAAGREAAFRNTASQCVEMIEGCLLRLADANAPERPVLETYRRGLKSLSAAARYAERTALEEPLARQLRVLDAAMRAGAALGAAERAELAGAFDEARSALGLAPEAAGATAPAAVQPEASAPAERPGAAASPATLRIDQNKLDRLMRVVGELLVARGAFPLLAQRLAGGDGAAGVAKDLKEAGSTISRIADELQNSVMSIRMLPVKTVFQRFPRLVRDLARSLGKEVRLEIEGEGIELDKTILEQIGDPLVHVIRNAVDHGIEPPEERRARGKEAAGQLTLRAFHEAGGVAIEIRDDGRGIDAEALKRKAVEKGLLAPEAAAALSGEAAFQLVFLPGLTTAAAVTDVSGRGVGMDVVQSNVRNLQGTIGIRSELGSGTAFLIRLPTSLMISKGILLEAGGQEYILPLASVRDMVKLPREAMHRHGRLTIAQVRGTIYPVAGLAELLGLAPAPAEELSVAIVEAGSMRYGLVVDKFLCEVEVLVKPLAGGLAQCREFQGASIMGDGRVVLVLNALECHSLDKAACG